MDFAEVNDVKKRKDGSWKNIDMRVLFYQNNIKCAVINYTGRVMNDDQFKKLRNKEKYIEACKIFSQNSEDTEEFMEMIDEYDKG